MHEVGSAFLKAGQRQPVHGKSQHDRHETSVMFFSNEPMICIYSEFGVRLKDHFYLSGDGAKWFTKPSYSIDDPFGYEA